MEKVKYGDEAAFSELFGLVSFNACCGCVPSCECTCCIFSSVFEGGGFHGFLRIFKIGASA